MEDLNTIAADCVVICCCCQCLILQVLVFALLGLPAKLAKRTREFVKRKLNRGRRSGEIVKIEEEEHCVRVGAGRESGFGDDEEDEGRQRCGKCIEEVEKVMMELYEKGEFGFGSFWGRGREGEESGCSVPAINVGTPSQIEQVEDGGDDHFVKYQIIQTAGSSRKT
ncbi:uncharacterized protein LOC114733143 [Neltuma alba]|uniref:uncharacterized protein LOC114733143 n=1 Tax=Neltuma alba TaxID=207710 RepID=UPI0010A4C398|nr:uncharacterized protein LOC114733143 [Prosopis alba]